MIPVDTDALFETLEHLREDAENTSWLQLLYRLEGISVLILIPTVLMFGMILAYEQGINASKIQNIGMQYTIGFLLFTLITIAKITLWIVNQINSGKSIWKINQEPLSSFVALKTTGSSLLVIAPIYLVMHIDVAFKTLVIMSILSFIVLFLIIAGICGVCSTAVLVRDRHFS